MHGARSGKKRCRPQQPFPASEWLETNFLFWLMKMYPCFITSDDIWKQNVYGNLEIADPAI